MLAYYNPVRGTAIVAPFTLEFELEICLNKLTVPLIPPPALLNAEAAEAA
jgi:hypothetical protein